MGPEYREVEDVPWLCELEEELFPFCRLQEELRATLAKDVPTQGRSTLMEDRNLRVGVNPICDPVCCKERKKQRDRIVQAVRLIGLDHSPDMPPPAILANRG